MDAAADVDWIPRRPGAKRRFWTIFHRFFIDFPRFFIDLLLLFNRFFIDLSLDFHKCFLASKQ